MGWKKRGSGQIFVSQWIKQHLSIIEDVQFFAMFFAKSLCKDLPMNVFLVKKCRIPLDDQEYGSFRLKMRDKSSGVK